MTYLPRTHHGFHLPPSIGHLLLLLLAVLVPIGIWAALDHGTTNDESSIASVEANVVDPASLRGVAYVVPGQFSDEVHIRSLDTGLARVVATIPHIFSPESSAAAQGTTSPTGDVLAVLAVAQDGVSESLLYATLHLVGVGEEPAVIRSGLFDPASRIAWAHDGATLALTRSGAADDAGRRSASLIEVDAASGAETEIAHFDDVFEIAPVGYSADGERLLAVAIDASGSALWSIGGKDPELLGTLSAGKTRDWSLSPDGSRLAYIEVLSAADRAYAGRTFLIAAGRVVESEQTGNQLGTAWRPGVGTADFGSQEGGAWVLDPPPAEPVFIVPMGWAPDGSALIASIHPIVDGRVSPEGSLQIAWPDRRVSLEDGARFLGFVVDE